MYSTAPTEKTFLLSSIIFHFSMPETLGLMSYPHQTVLFILPREKEWQHHTTTIEQTPNRATKQKQNK
jgi:hypothetical protein